VRMQHIPKSIRVICAEAMNTDVEVKRLSNRRGWVGGVS